MNAAFKLYQTITHWFRRTAQFGRCATDRRLRTRGTLDFQSNPHSKVPPMPTVQGLSSDSEDARIGLAPTQLPRGHRLLRVHFPRRSTLGSSSACPTFPPRRPCCPENPKVVEFCDFARFSSRSTTLPPVPTIVDHRTWTAEKRPRLRNRPPARR